MPEPSTLARARRSPAVRWLGRGGAVLALLVVFEYLLLPHLVGAREAVDLLARTNPWLIVGALGLEACSLLSYSALSRTALGTVSVPGYSTILRIDLTGLGASHLLIGGGAAAAGLRYRLLDRAGVDTGLIVASTAIQTAISLAVLALIFITGVGLTVIGTHPFVVLGVASSIAGLIALGALRVRHERIRGLPAVSPAWRIPHLPLRLQGVLDDLQAQVRIIEMTPWLFGRYALWAAFNWVFDAASLALCLYAFGFTPNLGQLLWVYGIANLLALLPITPGGIGLVEGVMVPALIAFGATHSEALLGVLTWRLVEYWLPIPVAGLAYASLKIGGLHHDSPSRSEPM